MTYEEYIPLSKAAETLTVKNSKLSYYKILQMASSGEIPNVKFGKVLQGSKKHNFIFRERDLAEVLSSRK